MMPNYKNTVMAKAFSIIIGLFPLLSVYKSPVPNVDLATVLLISFFLLNICLKIYKDDINQLFLFLILQTPIVLIASSSINVPLNTVVVRLGKMLLTLFIVFVSGARLKYYDENYTIAAIGKIVYITSIFILFQRIAYLFGIVIQNPFLALASNEAYDVNQRYMAGYLYRPSGFFLEPAHFALFAIPFLCYSLLGKENIKNATIVTIGILCTGSGLGLVAIAVIYAAYFLIRFRKHLIRTAALLIVAIIAIGLLSRTQFMQQVIMRFTTDNIAYGGNALQARIGIGYNLFRESPTVTQLFGHGYGNVPANIYFNGLSYILYTLGYAGVLCFFIIILRSVVHETIWKKTGLLITAGLIIYSQIFNPAHLAYYFCLYTGSRYSAREITVSNK